MIACMPVSAAGNMDETPVSPFEEFGALLLAFGAPDYHTVF
jgi:hypothetical protein